MLQYYFLTFIGFLYADVLVLGYITISYFDVVDGYRNLFFDSTFLLKGLHKDPQLADVGCHRTGSVPGWDTGRRMNIADSRPHSEREGGLPGGWTSQGPLEGNCNSSEPLTHISNLLL